MSGVSPTVTLQSWGGLSSGVHQQTNEQTNKQNMEYLSKQKSLEQTWYPIIKQVVACYKNTKENILDYQWFSIRHIL
jgi:hypothetical protein